MPRLPAWFLKSVLMMKSCIDLHYLTFADDFQVNLLADKSKVPRKEGDVWPMHRP